MTDEELRALVREEIARHLGADPPRAGAPERSGWGSGPAPASSSRRPASEHLVHAHPSHTLLVFAAVPDPDGRCIIEPAVACTGCGYCKSYGH